jgi:hypothetical protein
MLFVRILCLKFSLSCLADPKRCCRGNPYSNTSINKEAWRIQMQGLWEVSIQPAGLQEASICLTLSCLQCSTNAFLMQMLTCISLWNVCCWGTTQSLVSQAVVILLSSILLFGWCLEIVGMLLKGFVIVQEFCDGDSIDPTQCCQTQEIGAGGR